MRIFSMHSLSMGLCLIACTAISACGGGGDGLTGSGASGSGSVSELQFKLEFRLEFKFQL